MTKSQGPPPIVYIAAALVVGGAGFALWRNRDSLANLIPSFGGGSGGQVTVPDVSDGTNATDSGNLPDTGDTFRAVDNVPAGTFNYGGSTTWAPIRGEVDGLIQAVRPEFQLRYTDPLVGNPGSGTGIRMLLDNQLAFSQSSRALKPEEYEEARQRGFELEEIPVALDAIAFAVHPSQTVPGLTIEQIRDIYLGTITNWQQVGGPNLPITPYTRRLEAGGTVQFFQENILAEAPFGGTVEYVPDTTQALRAVGRDPSGIYYASVPEVVPQCIIKPLPVGRQAGQFVAPYAEPYVPSQNCPA
jgi:phosphate transport system substrate-binding protein